ncbi:uncharacterized protein [Paramormyrops kingsleyae]|uniref:uncharacterized protein n=1 Tax=Paramormyrops kingsleyae TaxID=1676925 RepID=UPI003B97C46B
MAQFDLVAFTLYPTLEQFDVCRKDDLLQIADFFNILVPAEASKRVVKQILLDELVQQGILPELGGSPSVAATPVRMSAVAEASSDDPGSGHRMDLGDPRSTREDLLLTIKLRELELEIKRQEYQAQLLRVRAMEMEAEKELELRRMSMGDQKPMPLPRKAPTPGTPPPAARSARDQADAQDAPRPRPRSPLSSPVSPEIGRSSFDVSRHIGLVPVFRENEVDAYFSIFERIAMTLNWPKHLWSLLLQCKLVGKAQEVCSALALEQSLDYDIVKATVLRAYELVPEAYRQNFRNLPKSASQTYVEFAREKAVLFDKWCGASGVFTFDQLKELVLLEEFKNCVPDRVVVYLNEKKVTSLTEAATLADEFVLTHKTVFTPIPLPRKTRPVVSSPSSASSPPPVEKRECFYCHEVGHIISVCPVLKRKEARSAARKVNVAACPDSSSSSSSRVDAAFEPFVFTGSVSLSEMDARHPVTILRDTGAAQSFLVEGVIPLCDKTYCGTDVLVQGIDLCVAGVPLHTVYLCTPDFSGYVRVAVQPQLPVPGITFILGNDIAGKRIVPLPEVVLDPVLCENDVAVEHPTVFPACVLTRAQRRQLADIDLEDTFMSVPVLDKPSKIESVTPDPNNSVTSPEVPFCLFSYVYFVIFVVFCLGSVYFGDPCGFTLVWGGVTCRKFGLRAVRNLCRKFRVRAVSVTCRKFRRMPAGPPDVLPTRRLVARPLDTALRT